MLRDILRGARNLSLLSFNYLKGSAKAASPSGVPAPVASATTRCSFPTPIPTAPSPKWTKTPRMPFRTAATHWQKWSVTSNLFSLGLIRILSHHGLRDGEVLPVLQKMTDREQKRPKMLPVLQFLYDREHLKGRFRCGEADYDAGRHREACFRVCTREKAAPDTGRAEFVSAHVKRPLQTPGGSHPCLQREVRAVFQGLGKCLMMVRQLKRIEGSR